MTDLAPRAPRRQADNDRLIATITKTHRKHYRVSIRPDDGGTNVLVALWDRDPSGVERHVNGVGFPVNLARQIIDALRAAEIAAKAEGAQ
jgi:hypothetical protein